MISPASQFSDPRHELWSLLDALCEDRLSGKETGRLEEWILTDADARRIYRDYIELHGSLYWDTALAGESPSPIPAASSVPGHGKPAAVVSAKPSSLASFFQAKQSLLAMAVLLLAGLGLWWGGVFRNEAADPRLANQPNPSNPLPSQTQQRKRNQFPKDVLPLVAVKPFNESQANEEPWPAIAAHCAARGSESPSSERLAEQGGDERRHAETAAAAGIGGRDCGGDQ